MVNSAVNLTSINIDTQINFAANKLRLPQSGSFLFINNSRNTASPILDQIHISKRMSKSFIFDNSDDSIYYSVTIIFFFPVLLHIINNSDYLQTRLSLQKEGPSDQPQKLMNT